MELITVVAVIGTATTMFPFLRRLLNETIALWHVSFRFFRSGYHYCWLNQCTVSSDFKPGTCSSRSLGYRRFSSLRYGIKSNT